MQFTIGLSTFSRGGWLLEAGLRSRRPLAVSERSLRPASENFRCSGNTGREYHRSRRCVNHLRSFLETTDAETETLTLDLKLGESLFADEINKIFDFLQIHAGLLTAFDRKRSFMRESLNR
jgi:hypothetical protein